MKFKIASSIVIAGTFLALSGCATPQTASLPNNSLRIVNRTPYTQYLLRNGEPWHKNVNEGNRMYSVPITIGPKDQITITDCSASKAERVVLEFRAVKKHITGCIASEASIGTHDELALLGASIPGRVIVLHSDDF